MVRHKLLPFNNPAFRSSGKHPLTGRQQDRLVEPLRFQLTMVDDSNERHGGIDLLVPKDFVTNYANIPRVLWSVFPPNDERYRLASVMHDYLYCAKICSRFVADALFRDAMRALGTPALVRVVMYYAVRAFGGRAWKRAKL